MKKREFAKIRHYLGKTQGQLAQLLCMSPRAIQSYEQGWRNIPPGAERQLLFLLSLKRSADENVRPCWEIRDCPDEWRDNCIAWEYKVGDICWFVNGTFCEGEFNNIWEEKMQFCRQCEAYEQMIAITEE
jgi:transcriptional regulator with XRE-family HTH domain